MNNLGPAWSEARLFTLKFAWCRHLCLHMRGRLLAAMRQSALEMHRK